MSLVHRLRHCCRNRARVASESICMIMKSSWNAPNRTQPPREARKPPVCLFAKLIVGVMGFVMESLLESSGIPDPTRTVLLAITIRALVSSLRWLLLQVARAAAFAVRSSCQSITDNLKAISSPPAMAVLMVTVTWFARACSAWIPWYVVDDKRSESE
jgi:hypothetical protein